MDNIRVVKEITLTVKKKPVVLVVSYLGSISLKTRTKLKKSLKNILNYCKLRIMFKNKTRLGNNFHFNDRIPKDLIPGVAKFQCGNVRIGEHIGLSPLTKKKLSLRTAP